MEVYGVRRLFHFVVDLFTDGDHIPLVDSHVIAHFEQEVAKAKNGSSDEVLSKRVISLSWALIHSRQSEDVRQGIAMIKASTTGPGSSFQFREKLYYEAIGLVITELGTMQGAGSL